MSNALKRVVSGNKPLSSDANQYYDTLNATIDVGALSLFPPLPTPSAPNVAINTTSGVLNGAYKYVLVNVTGWTGSDGTIYVQGFAPSALSSSVSPASQQVNVTWSAGPSGTIAQALYRTTAGGSSAKFLAYFANNTTTSYTDNVADATLGTGMPTSYSGTAIPSSVPTSNTTGTSLTGTLGANNASVSQRRALTLDTDTRTTNLTYTNGQLTQVQIVDPTNSNAVIDTITLAYTNGQLTTVTETAGGHTVTTTLSYTNGQLSSVTKAVN